jgi:hypothetical protein
MTAPASLLDRLAGTGGYAADLTLTEGLAPGVVLDGEVLRWDHPKGPPARRNAKGAAMSMWVWIIAFLAVVVLLAKWMDRSRGSRGASRQDDLPGTSEGRGKRIDSGGTMGSGS